MAAASAGVACASGADPVFDLNGFIYSDLRRVKGDIERWKAAFDTMGLSADDQDRIFYRNAINTGLPIMEAPDAADGISDGDKVTVDADSGVIVNETTGAVSLPALPYRNFESRWAAQIGLRLERHEHHRGGGIRRLDLDRVLPS